MRIVEKTNIAYIEPHTAIITRAMWEDVQKQKEKNQRSYCRNRVYIFFEKLICPTCGNIMTCKGAGGSKAKYLYYHCDNCNLYYNESEIIIELGDKEFWKNKDLDLADVFREQIQDFINYMHEFKLRRFYKWNYMK